MCIGILTGSDKSQMRDPPTSEFSVSACQHRTGGKVRMAVFWSFWSRSFQPLHYWCLGQDNSLLGIRELPGAVGGLAAPLTSSTTCPEHTSNYEIPKMSLDIGPLLFSGGQNSLPPALLRTTDLNMACRWSAALPIYITDHSCQEVYSLTEEFRSILKVLESGASQDIRTSAQRSKQLDNNSCQICTRIPVQYDKMEWEYQYLKSLFFSLMIKLLKRKGKI